MIQSDNGLYRLEKTDIKHLAQAAAEAFKDDPLTLYLLQGNTQKARRLPMVFEYYAALGIKYGQAYASSPNMEAVSVWFDAPVRISLLQLISCGFPVKNLWCGFNYFQRDMQLNNLCDKMRDQLYPFSNKYLALLAVAPKHRSKGLASKVVRPILAELDRNNITSYLETQNLQNVNMYRHWGYEEIGSFSIPLGNISLHAMLRKNRKDQYGGNSSSISLQTE
ncbi:N-acetyltransferase [Dehalococcoides mccartyi]|jgi:ribosomal protein S18 acetylase RimI-like enzyme|uniref:GNAT family N-acetyltransferase n=1 Tax=Dehalococcoides mccartyi TaxID=61435 RepID=UPI0003C845CE|nr:GNAT family N-acetyltransferase [Dehalococcoides mccartyi]AHB13636.1 GNAT family acetyltransferase [Dehalococcoides mccartyi GY50]AII58019.1 acetyltransferase [Dehalococcoides mccartyi CG1]APH12532.1 acetyltransferase [Dehalococcoides mccartyi]